jgi:hypothetical protein
LSSRLAFCVAIKRIDRNEGSCFQENLQQLFAVSVDPVQDVDRYFKTGGSFFIEMSFWAMASLAPAQASLYHAPKPLGGN